MNDLNLKVGFDINKFTSELNKTNSLLTSWGNQVKSTIGAAFGVFAVQRFAREVVASLAEFEKSMSEVKAITGATGKEFDTLRNNALNLAGAFKAVDISKLETEFGRLGFSTKEILQATEATIDLAVATGSDLATSAIIAGSTLRAFNLDASQTKRVADSMAAALNISGLDMSNFAESIKYVAPNAYAANISLEETSALLGILADNGIKGSMAGTTLRRIIQDLAKDGRPLTERLLELSKAGLTLSGAFDEVGRIGSTGLLILAKNGEEIEPMTQKIISMTGEAKAMSRVMQDNLIGDTKKFSAALDKSVQSGTSLNTVLRQITQSGTSWLNLLNQIKVVDNGSDAFIGGLIKRFGAGNFAKLADLLGQGEMFRNLIAGIRTNVSSTGNNGPDKKDDVLVTVSTLNSLIDDLNVKIKASGSGSQIDTFRKQIENLEMQIFSLMHHAEELSSKAHMMSKTLGLGDDNIGKDDILSGLTTKMPNSAESSMSKAASGIERNLEKIMRKLHPVKTELDGFHLSTQRLGMAMVTMGSQMSSGLALAIQGTVPFAQAMAQMALSVVDSIERIVLARIIEKAVDSSWNPIAALSAAVIGFAGIKALFGSIGSGGGSAAGGGISAPAQSRSIDSHPINMNIGGEIRIRNQDLVLAIDRGKYQLSRGG